MRLKFSFICDHANATEDGKLNVLGIFDRLYAPRFPCMHRVLCLVLAFETEPDDAGTSQEMIVRFGDPDGQSIREVKGMVTFGVGKQTINQIHVMNDLSFQVAGDYEFSISVDGRVVQAVPLELVQVEAKA